jgi:L-ascorbate metabolism protein UlaG (beta-lactamase superfamily)
VEVAPNPVPAAPGATGVTVTWIGQSSFLIQTPQGNFLTDPVYSERIGPVSWAGPRRVAAPGVPWEALPGIDAVLLSHDHFDHCDLPTLRRAMRRWNPVVIAPLGHAGLLARARAAASTVELDWWQDRKLSTGASVMLVPARHWTRRNPFETDSRLWGGFMLRAGGRLTYFVGDSGYDEALFPEIGRRCGRPDLALIPIGAYEPRWFMHDAHMNPAEAVHVHSDVGARRSVAMHWGTFQLTDEGREDPPRELGEALRARNIPEGEFLVLPLGGSLHT